MVKFNYFLLQESMVPYLTGLFSNDDDPNYIEKHIWFQQDGVSPRILRLKYSNY